MCICQRSSYRDPPSTLLRAGWITTVLKAIWVTTKPKWPSWSAGLTWILSTSTQEHHLRAPVASPRLPATGPQQTSSLSKESKLSRLNLIIWGSNSKTPIRFTRRTRHTMTQIISWGAPRKRGLSRADHRQTRCSFSLQRQLWTSLVILRTYQRRYKWMSASYSKTWNKWKLLKKKITRILSRTTHVSARIIMRLKKYWGERRPRFKTLAAK